MKNHKRVHGLTPQQLSDTGQKTANYQRELLLEHRACKQQNNADQSVTFIQKSKRWAIECTDCLVYKKEEVITK